MNHLVSLLLCLSLTAVSADEGKRQANGGSMETCGCSPHAPVAFKAHLSHTINPAANQIIIFDDVQMNIGGAYHAHNGMFVAPQNGLYQFALSICSGGGHFVVVDLLKKGSMIGRVLAGDPSYTDCASEMTNVQLAAGDEVYMAHHGTAGDLITYSPAYLCSFTGVLLQTL